MIKGKRLVVVLPAYNAALTLRRTVAEIDRSLVDEILVVDDASTDGTVEEARTLGLETIRHDRNKGYGGNQKTCYHAALERANAAAKGNDTAVKWLAENPDQSQ